MTVKNPTDVYHTVNLVTQWLCIPIVSAFVALRFYTRFRFNQRLGVEDCEYSDVSAGTTTDLMQMRAQWLGYASIPGLDTSFTDWTGPFHGILRNQYTQ